jgi:chain length determinant protein EpsF
MNLNQILYVFRARYRLILLVLVVTVAAAIAVSMTLPPRYKATSTLVFEFKSVDPVTGAFLPVQLLLSSYMATEVDILESQAVALKVVDKLGLADDPDTQKRFMEATDGRGSVRDWLASGLRGALEVKPSKESRIIDVNFTSPDPEFSARAANAFADAYIQTNLDMKVGPAREASAWFDDQLAQLRQQLEAAQERLTRYQAERGITTNDQRLDVETTRLSELSSQLVQAQGQSFENASRQKQLQEFTARGMDVDSLPEVLSSPIINELKAKLSTAEAKLNQASNSLGVNHPEYQRAQAEVGSLRARLREEVKTASAVIGNNLRISQGRERELRDAVAAQKARMIDLNKNRDELGVLTKEVENAQRAYDSASQRHTQTSLESRLDKSNATVLAAATAPLSPSFPKMPVIVALAVVVGALLGMGMALAVEMLDRRVRGIEDMVQAAGAQVWVILADTAAIARDVEKRRKTFLKRPRTLTPVTEPRLE